MSDDDNLPDDFSSFIAEQQDDGEPEKIGMAVPPRFKTSIEAEEAEQIYLKQLSEGLLLPIPFFDEGADLPDPPTKSEAQDLWDRFRITPEEYQELFRRTS